MYVCLDFYHFEDVDLLKKGYQGDWAGATYGSGGCTGSCDDGAQSLLIVHLRYY